MTNYELFDIGLKCAGLAIVALLLALLLVPPIVRRRGPEEESDGNQYDDR
jgi:hypothetical protein